MKLILFVLTLLISPCDGFVSERVDLRKLINVPLHRIVGGQEVKESNNAYRFMVSLQRGYYNYHFCGGSLIAPKFVLTAGHCVKYGAPDRVVIGNYNIGNKDDGEIRTIKRVIKHPFYSGVQNDIAILELDDPVTSIVPVYLSRTPYQSPHEEDDAMTTVIGWGYTKEGSGIVMEKLRRVNVPIVSQERCSESYGGIDVTKICAGYDTSGRDSCSGDSGGPIFYTDPDNGYITQVGIVSYGRGCARGKFYGVYARNSAFTDFIIETLDEYGGVLKEKVPTVSPTNAPTTRRPTGAPTTGAPSGSPTTFPTVGPPTFRPTAAQTEPSARPTTAPALPATLRPTSVVTERPSLSRMAEPTERPTSEPTTSRPTGGPTSRPTRNPTKSPTPRPTTFRSRMVTETEDLSFCSTRVKRRCGSSVRRTRCFWNDNDGAPLVKGFLAKACLPNFLLLDLHQG